MTEAPIDDGNLLLLHAYVDGELDAATALDIERRLAADPELAAEHARLKALQQAIRERLPREPVPQHVRDFVLGMARLPQPARVPAWRPPSRARLALAAALILGIGLGGGVTHLAERSMGGAGSSYAALDAAVAGHIRALAAGTPFDVASSDRHTVKPWFAGKVMFAPQVVDLAEQGFPLAGGRVDVIAGRTAATLVFRHDKHIVSLTAAPDPNGVFEAPLRTTRDGFSAVHWWANGVAYWAVSDAAPEEVDAFASAFRAKAQAP